jgi:hypothetical protein
MIFLLFIFWIIRKITKKLLLTKSKIECDLIPFGGLAASGRADTFRSDPACWRAKKTGIISKIYKVVTSVADPEDRIHVFGPPGSGSVILSYGSGSFHHQAKIVIKSLIPTVFAFFMTIYL